MCFTRGSTPPASVFIYEALNPRWIVISQIL
jgi:hypothetical protein